MVMAATEPLQTNATGRGDTILVNSNAGFIQVPVINPVTGKQQTDPQTGAPVFVTVPGNISGTLDKLLGDLEVVGPPAAAGKYKLQLSDQGATGVAVPSDRQRQRFGADLRSQAR